MDPHSDATNILVDGAISTAQNTLNEDPSTFSSVQKSGKSFWVKYSVGLPHISIVCTGKNHDQSSANLNDPISIDPILAKEKSGFLIINGTISVNEITDQNKPSKRFNPSFCLYTDDVSVNVAKLDKIIKNKIIKKVEPAYCFSPKSDPFANLR